MANTVFKTPRQISTEQKQKVKALFSGVKLPRFWIAFFVKDNPAYQGQEVFLRNVKTGISCPTDGLLNDLKIWIKKNKI